MLAATVFLGVLVLIGTLASPGIKPVSTRIWFLNGLGCLVIPMIILVFAMLIMYDT